MVGHYEHKTSASHKEGEARMSPYRNYRHVVPGRGAMQPFCPLRGVLQSAVRGA